MQNITNTNENIHQNLDILPKANKGMLYVLSGPSGAGKTSLALKWHQLNKDIGYTHSITTRKARVTEEQYVYISKEEFKKKIENDEFIQWVHPAYDEYYGTLKKPIEEAIAEGRDMVFDYCPEGYLNLKRLYPENIVGIFVMAPSFSELEKRLTGRGTETDEELIIRHDMAMKDLNFVDQHKYHLTNENLEDSLNVLDSIRQAEKYSLNNQNVLELYNAKAKKALIRYYTI